MNTPPHPNDLLHALPARIREHWVGQGRVLQLRAGQLLSDMGAMTGNVYFPLTAVLAWVSWLSDGACSAIALIGPEGMIGEEHMRGMGHHLMVLCAGEVLEVPAHVIAADEKISAEVHTLCTDNLHSLMAQASQTAICNQHHGLQQRLSRFLHSVFERTDADTLYITHEQMADLLGTRRERISHVASLLQQLGVIRYARGCLTVTDKHRLLEQVCECCGAMQRPRRLATGGWPTSPLSTPAPSGFGWRNA